MGRGAQGAEGSNGAEGPGPQGRTGPITGASPLEIQTNNIPQSTPGAKIQEQLVAANPRSHASFQKNVP